MIHVLSLYGALAADSNVECHLGPPPVIYLVAPSKFQSDVSGSTFDVVIDVPVNLHAPLLEVVPFYDEDKSSVDRLPADQPQRILLAERIRMDVTKNQGAGSTRISATVHLEIDPQIVHKYVLVVSFSFAGGECETTYSDLAGIVNVLPSPK